MSLPITRWSIVTDANRLRIPCKKIGTNQGIKLGSKMIQFINQYEVPCLGMAAPQINELSRVFVLKTGTDGLLDIFVNPVLLDIGPMEESQVEGCLSIPDKLFHVMRPTSITVRDDVHPKPFELTGWQARIWLHEFGHLNGELVCDIGIELTEEQYAEQLSNATADAE